MLDKAFNLIASKLGGVLCPKGFSKSFTNNKNIIFRKDEAVYGVKFLDNKFILFKGDSSTDGEGETRKICEWFFDPSSGTLDDAAVIANDFLEFFSKSSGKNDSSLLKKDNSKAESDGLHFFLNRLVTLFPELKPELTTEREMYLKFRYVTFIKENFVPKFLEALRNKKKEKIKRISSILNNFYENGNMDVRSTITMVILNSIDDKSSAEEIEKFLDNNLKEAFLAAKKYKLKKVKPERLKTSLIGKFLAANKTLS